MKIVSAAEYRAERHSPTKLGPTNIALVGMQTAAPLQNKKVAASRDVTMAEYEDISASAAPTYPAANVKIDGVDFYVVLGVAKTATAKEISNAYKRMSLKVHPDRNKGHEEEATAKFQALGRIHMVLSDPERRAVYDQTGDVDDQPKDPQSFDAWTTYFRDRFPQVTLEAVKAFEAKFKNSDEEREEVLQAYVDSEGDMQGILDGVTLATVDDESRFRKIIKAAIKKGEIEEFSAFTGETSKQKAARVARANKEAQEAIELAAELGLSGAKDPTALIKSRAQREFEDMTSILEAKYGGGSAGGKGKSKGGKSKGKGKGGAGAGGGGKRSKTCLPSEEDFERIQAEMEARKAARKG